MRLKTAVLALATLAALATAGRAQDQSSQQSTPGAPQKPLRIRLGGNVAEAKLISKTQPIYPPLAAQSDIQGNVILHAVIGLDGAVKTLAVISGKPLLIQAALDAVRQWKYQPTLLNGDPVEVDTTITVAFVLDKNSPEPQTPPAEGSPARAPDAAASPAIDPQLKTDILHLFDVMKLRENMGAAMHSMFDNMRPTLVQSLPPTPNRDKIIDAYFGKLVTLTQSDDFFSSATAVYAKYLSDDDIKALTVFYGTPAGQHYNAVASKIFAESARLGAQTMTQNLPRILGELCTEYPELQGQAKFCPAVKPNPADAHPTPGVNGGVEGGVLGGVEAPPPSGKKP